VRLILVMRLRQVFNDVFNVVARPPQNLLDLPSVYDRAELRGIRRDAWVPAVNLARMADNAMIFVERTAACDIRA